MRQIFDFQRFFWGTICSKFKENIRLIHVILRYSQSYNLARAFCQIFSANSNIFWERGSQDPPLFPRLMDITSFDLGDGITKRETLRV